MYPGMWLHQVLMSGPWTGLIDHIWAQITWLFHLASQSVQFVDLSVLLQGRYRYLFPQNFPWNFPLALIGCPSAHTPSLGSSVALGCESVQTCCALCAKILIFYFQWTLILQNAYLWLPLAFQVQYLHLWDFWFLFTGSSCSHFVWLILFI